MSQLALFEEAGPALTPEQPSPTTSTPPTWAQTSETPSPGSPRGSAPAGPSSEPSRRDRLVAALRRDLATLAGPAEYSSERAFYEDRVAAYRAEILRLEAAEAVVYSKRMEDEE